MGVLEGRAAREPASIVLCFWWVSPHREGTDSMRFLLRAGEKSGPLVECMLWGADDERWFLGTLSAMDFLPKNHQDWACEELLDISQELDRRACCSTVLACSGHGYEV